MAGYTFQQVVPVTSLQGPASSGSFSFTPNFAGDLVGVLFQVASATTHPTSVTDSALNAFTQRASIVTGSSSFYFWDLVNCAATSSILFNFSASGSWYISAFEYSFAHAGYSFQNEWNATIAAPGSGANAITFTTSSNLNPTALALGLVSCSAAEASTLSAGSGWTQRYRNASNQFPPMLVMDFEQTGAGAAATLNAQSTNGGNTYPMIVSAYTEATGGSAPATILYSQRKVLYFI